jgi:hypothetical protein
MSLFATAADFEQGGPGALYSNPPYMEYPYFQERINALIGRFAPNNQKLLIVGMGFGYLVNLAVTAGYDAFGIDNAYAVGKAQALFPSLASRFIVADALSASTLDAAAKTAGLHGGTPKWPLLITEDVLPCMSDAEIQTALTNLRARSSTNLLHFVMPDSGLAEAYDPRINWKTIDGWRAVLCPPDVVGDVETGLFWNANGQA